MDFKDFVNTYIVRLEYCILIFMFLWILNYSLV